MILKQGQLLNSLSRFILRSVFIMFAALFLCTAVLRVQAATDKPGDPATGETTLSHVRVEGVASDQLSMDVEEVGQAGIYKHHHLVVKETVVKDRLKQLQKGDRVTIVYSAEANQNVLKVLRI